jgi:DNA-binding response OmpR family regulator
MVCGVAGAPAGRLNELNLFAFNISVAYLHLHFYTPVKKILIVDDDTDILELIGILLPKHGFAVKKVTNGEDALKQAGIFAPDLILLDINIMGDGKEVCRQLKSGGSPYKNIPVILFSAAGDLEKKMAQSKADGFIQKPFDSLQLVNIIRQHTGVISPHHGNAIINQTNY